MLERDPQYLNYVIGVRVDAGARERRWRGYESSFINVGGDDKLRD